MNRIARIALCALFVLCCLTACDNSSEQGKLGQAQNEIYTYTRVDPKKTTLFVSTSGNDYISNLNQAFMQKNPDVQIITQTLTGGSGTSKPMADCVANGYAPDVMFVSERYFSNEYAMKYFENLSVNPVVQNYQAEALNRLAVNDNIYFLPGPSSVTCMLYNNSLFEQYGWRVPRTFDEFVALCIQIREDTNGAVQPWNPNAKYESNFAAVTIAFIYDELFGGLENRRWYDEFCAGKQTFAGHMEPYYEMIKTLIDNDIILEEHFTYSATARGNEFMRGEIAMYNYTVGSTRSGEYDIQYMPFPTTKGEHGYLVDNINTTVGVPVKTHTEKEKDAIQRYLEFFSSAEGQQIFIGDSLMFSNVRDVPLNNKEFLGGISDAIENGRYFSQLTFRSAEAATNISFSKDALAMRRSEMTGAECIARNDAKPFKTVESITPLPVLATASEDFTILETSHFIADVYREKADADIGLIAHCVVDRGNIMRIFKGDLDADDVVSLKPRSFANKTTLIKVGMTGRQLMDAMGHIVNYGAQDVNAVFAYSGLKCTVAPWKPLGEMMVSMTLMDGTPIDPAKIYTVALWEGTVQDEYITEVLSRYEGTWETLMTEALTAKKTIAPAKDRRVTIQWD